MKRQTLYISDYDDKVPSVPTAWLKKELEKLRRQISPKAGVRISESPVWSGWRSIAGMVRFDGDNETPTQQHYAAPRQAARLIVLALYRPGNKDFIKAAIGDDALENHFGYVPLAKHIDALNIDQIFDLWMDATGGEECAELLDKIQCNTQCLTGEQLSGVAKAILGKDIPPSNFNHILKDTGETVRKNKPCSRQGTALIMQWIRDRAGTIAVEVEVLTD